MAAKSNGHGSAKNSATKKFPVVGIGASAGGLEALEAFFKNMPADSGMAFVVIQHLDPDHEGNLPDLLQRCTRMQVMRAANNVSVLQDHVYVIPSNKTMTIVKGKIRLSEPLDSKGIRMTVDIFFRSLAEDYQEKSIGIILSGMGSDGSLGVKAIKEKNGIIAVQDPETAMFDRMPRNAISSVISDIIAPPEDLAQKVLAFIKLSPPVRMDKLKDINIRNNVDKIIFLLRQHTGHDFSAYKKSGIYRRIERRKGIYQIEKISEYVQLLTDNSKELDILFKELMIGVTSFFRDPTVWEKLRDEVIPGMLQNLPDGYSLRAWIPGCSTGEEAYSLAMVFKEAIERLEKHKNLTLQIFATDIDHDSIEKARKGVYSLNIATDVSPERISKFFSPDPEGYRVGAVLREMIVFAEQNIVRDPPFTRLDILSCRNLFIYLESERQKKLLSLFYYSIKPGGILVLGNAETLVNQKEGFIDIDSHLKIYKRSDSNMPTYAEIMDFPSAVYPPKSLQTSDEMHSKDIENLQIHADQFVIQNFTPPSVVVNEIGDIIYITGKTGKYLEPPAGKANWNIYAMARPGLNLEFPAAFRLARQSYDPVVLHDVKITVNGGIEHVDVTIQRIKFPTSIRNLIIFVFKDITHPTGFEKEIKSRRKSQRYKELENELEKRYEDLQSTREEMQASQEELKSINEELQSTNEELQSTNEELTISKEEMQSLNEELQTLNTELQSKVNDLVQANNDMKNLLNNTDIATLFLDKELSIRRFTDPVKKIFNLRNADVGRPFTDIVTNLQYPELEEHALKVLKTLSTIETPATTKSGLWFNVRIMPYRTEDDRIDGLVLTFNDITEIKKLEIELQKSQDELRNLRS